MIIETAAADYCRNLHCAELLTAIKDRDAEGARQKALITGQYLDEVIAAPMDAVIPLAPEILWLLQNDYREELWPPDMRARVVDMPVRKCDEFAHRVITAEEKDDAEHLSSSGKTYSYNLPGSRRPNLTQYDSRRDGIVRDRYYFGVYSPS